MLGAIATLGAGILGNLISANSAKAINDAQLKNQSDLYGEQINLANTAHQREVADLRLAGLNPILSASGQGAASPAAGSVDLQNPNAAFANLGDQVNSAVSGYAARANQASQRDLMAAQTTNTVATADNTAVSADLSRVELEKRKLELEWLKNHPEAQGTVFGKTPTLLSQAGELAGAAWQKLRDWHNTSTESHHTIMTKDPSGKLVPQRKGGVPEYHVTVEAPRYRHENSKHTPASKPKRKHN